MENINDGGPAFPARVSVNRDSGELQPHQFGNDDFCTPGLSLRDYFAAKALATSIGYASQDLSTWAPEDFAKHAYQIADAMLAARGAQ